MEWLALILVLALGLFILFLAVIWCARIGHWYLVSLLSSLEEELQQGASQIIERLERRAERRHLGRRFAVAAGTTSAIDADAVEARRQMPILRRVFDEDLPKAVVHCLRTQRFAAHAIGARFIWEIADEPECVGSRYRVVALAEAAMDILERYPFLVEDEMLTANLITLRRSHCADVQQLPISPTPSGDRAAAVPHRNNDQN